MAPRPEEEEVFTDLRGNPDKDAGADDAAVLEKGLKDLAQGETIEDADLEIEDEDEDGAAAAAAAGASDQDEDEEEEDGAAQAGADDFDPKDVVILTKDAELLETREKETTSARDRAKADIDTALKAMEEAKEAGDSKGDIAATQKYTAATIALRDAEDGLKVLAGTKADLTARAKDLYAKAPKDADGNAILSGKPGVARRASKQATEKEAAANRPSKLTPKFKAANAWFGNAKYAEQQKTLIAIDKGLAAEGLLNKDTPEYFTEMGKRFNAKHPGLYKNLDGKPIATGQRQRGNGTPIPGNGGGGGGGGGGNQQASQVKLTTADLGEMRKFGMDPENMAHRRTWLAEKRSLSTSKVA